MRRKRIQMRDDITYRPHIQWQPPPSKAPEEPPEEEIPAIEGPEMADLLTGYERALGQLDEIEARLEEDARDFAMPVDKVKQRALWEALQIIHRLIYPCTTTEEAIVVPDDDLGDELASAVEELEADLDIPTEERLIIERDI